MQLRLFMSSDPVFQLGIVDGRVTEWVTDLEGSIHELRDSFNRAHHARLSALLSESALKVVDRYLEREEFSNRAYSEIGAELRMKEGAAPSLLTFLVHNARLFELVRTITDCSRIRAFSGRISRLMPGSGFDWHTDAVHKRLAALSINLGRGHRGGELQIRDADGAITDLANPRPGDAILIPVGSGLQHRVTVVVGDIPRTVFTGWFLSEGPETPLLASF
jgi:hypothetical protein